MKPVNATPNQTLKAGRLKTLHTLVFDDARHMPGLDDNSVDLVVTSPPYPMIDMWDSLFCSEKPVVKKYLGKGKGSSGPKAFEAMHRLLDPVWEECFRILKPGRFACINIGDATRTLNGAFSLYPNHARILSKALEIGFTCLPCILWRKQTNAPNKFMGSGMLPAGAYVTLEHEYILILRKGGKREFIRPADKENRRRSALFWEERNTWFSDIWLDLKGTTQSLKNKADRKRSAAFPFELAYRLINMYSVQNDRILDPFLGTGTTLAAALASGRNSVGVEIDPSFAPVIQQTAEQILPLSQELVRQRLERHVAFIQDRIRTKGQVKHTNIHYGFPVVTSQEKELLLSIPTTLDQNDPQSFEVTYDPEPMDAFSQGRNRSGRPG